MRYLNDARICMLLIAMFAVLIAGVLTHLAGYSANKVATTDNGVYGEDAR